MDYKRGKLIWCSESGNYGIYVKDGYKHRDACQGIFKVLGGYLGWTLYEGVKVGFDGEKATETLARKFLEDRGYVIPVQGTRFWKDKNGDICSKLGADGGVCPLAAGLHRVPGPSERERPTATEVYQELPKFVRNSEVERLANLVVEKSRKIKSLEAEVKDLRERLVRKVEEHTILSNKCDGLIDEKERLEGKVSELIGENARFEIRLGDIDRLMHDLDQYRAGESPKVKALEAEVARLKGIERRNIMLEGMVYACLDPEGVAEQNRKMEEGLAKGMAELKDRSERKGSDNGR
jgi:hypothetical protein